MKKYIFLTLLLSAFIMFGCATMKDMAIDKSSKILDVKENSVLLVTLDISRSDKSTYFLPDCISVTIEKPNAKNMADVIYFTVPYENEAPYENKIKTDDKKFIYLLRLALKPGEYHFKSIDGRCLGFPNGGSYLIPLLLDINVKKDSVTYMGRIEVFHRPRKDNEFRAGGLIPLFDQAVAGISTGTLDIKILDMAKEDIEIFKSTFPILKNTVINTEILPDFDRPKVQRWWEGESTETKK